MSNTIGKKIKQLREAAELKIEELAEAAGIQAAKIELIENGEVSPSISTLLKIARRFGVRLGTILDGTEASSPVVTSVDKLSPSVNPARGEDRDHLYFYSLAGHKSDRSMEPFIVNVKYIPNAKENYSTHEGEEFIYVLEGAIEVYYGTEKHVVSEGESIYYDSIVPHLVTTTGEGQTARLLAVTYTPY